MSIAKRFWVWIKRFGSLGSSARSRLQRELARRLRPSRRRLLRLESLESRRVFATASLSAGMLSIDLNQTDEVAYLTNDGTSLRLASSHLASELSFSTAAVSSIQVTDTTQKTGQSFSLSYGLPLSLSGSMSVSQIETVVFGSELTVSGASGLSVTESQSIQVRAPLSTTGDPIVFSARDGITITHPVISDGGNQTLDADKDADGVGTLTLDFPVNEFTDPNPNSGNGFGTEVLVLPSGNVVVTSPNDDFGGSNAGAVYLFNGMTGSLISSLRGSSANNQVGNTELVQLTNGNYVVASNRWDSGTITDVGAVTWGSGVLGVSGVVSSSNSLVGSTLTDRVGRGSVTALNNGNYVVRSWLWDSGTIIDVGAVTWGNGTSGISGVVSSSNSMVGSSASDTVGGTRVTALSNGNYVVAHGSWDSGTIVNVGAVTWGNGTSGISGVVSSSNSLVGSSASDEVGGTGVTALSNGNYVVRSIPWDSGTIVDVGAVTWGNGTSGISGVVSSSNSLVGSSASDTVGGIGVTALSNGNYVVASADWDSGTITNVGAVTWGNGTSGISGVVSSSNSLVGSSADDIVGFDGVGSTGVTALSNGNYVVASADWDSGTVTDVGAVTWGNGTSGISGVVSSSNSLVGSSGGDVVGYDGVTALSNGNYVVRSNRWDSGTITNVGAVTWGDGTSGISGVVSSSNSIVGQTADRRRGSWSITTASNLDAFLATNPSDGSGRVVLGSSARGFSLPSTPAGSLQAANGSVSLSVAETNLQGTISSNANVSIAPSQTARQIDLGSKPSGILGLSDTELDRIAAANLSIGSSTSGDLTVSSPISRPTSTAMQLTSGGAILLDTGAQSTNGAINTAGGTLSLDAGTTIRPVTPGVDASTSAFSFAAGDTLQIDINGATVDSDYSQLSIVGPVTLTGVTLSLNVNFLGMTGTETFTIVSATGGVTGQFSSLIQDGAISVGSFAYTANYTANSVELVPAIAPAITQSPSNQTVSSGATASFTAAATGNPTPTVQWQVSTNGGTSWSDISNATNTTYSFTAASGDNGNQYRAVFTNTAGSATSSAATLTVNYAPSVTQNPSNSTVDSGTTASFTAAAIGNPTPTVQWQVSTNGGTSWSDISGATNTTYSFTAASGDNGNQYRAVFTNTVGSATSSAATLTVGTSPVFTSSATATFVATQPGSFQVTASGSPQPSFEIVSGSLPSGITLSAAGVLQGTAALAAVGDYPITIRAWNGIGTPPTQNFTLRIADPLAANALDVSQGQIQRSYIRYLDITTAQISVASQIVSSNRIRLRKADLNGNGSQDVPLTGFLSANGAKISVDFGAAGIQNSRNTNGADGYYTLELDLDNDNVFETSLRFYRLLGDVNGDRQVNSADQTAVTAAIGSSNPQYDVNGDGIVNSTDVLMVRRALGRKLASGLAVDD